MTNTELLKGKTIAITGASRGIGEKTASLLRQSGANLVLGSRSFTKQQNRNQLQMHLDVSDESSVIQFFEEAVSAFDKIDVLINSAGIGTFENVVDSSTDAFDEMLSVNLRGTYLACKYFAKHMAEQGAGKILNLVSVVGTTPVPGCGGYSASKHGVYGLSKVLQAELRQKGVQVIAVIPGAVKSSFWDRIDPKPDMEKMIPAETIAEHLVYLISQSSTAFIDEITIMPPLGIL